jgi:hypothetical protein
MTLDDVFKGVKSYWDGDAGLTATVPGGLWWEKPDQDAAYPQAVMMAVEQSPEFTSGDAGIQQVDIDIVVRSIGGAVDGGGIQKRIRSLFARDSRDDLLIAGITKVLDVWPRPQAVKLDPVMKDAKDVVVATAAFSLLLQLDF